MTQTFAADANNDLFLGKNGNLAIVSGLEAVLQNCAHLAKSLLGEMVLETDQGLPYRETLWTGAHNVAQFEAALRAGLLGVDGVSEITSLNINQVGNTLKYAADIVTIYGAGSVNG